jgi:beta-mannosidase
VSVKDSELVHFSDNFFDLYPGEPYTVKVKINMSAEELASRLQYNCVNKFLY